MSALGVRTLGGQCASSGRRQMLVVMGLEPHTDYGAPRDRHPTRAASRGPFPVHLGLNETSALRPSFQCPVPLKPASVPPATQRPVTRPPHQVWNSYSRRMDLRVPSVSSGLRTLRYKSANTDGRFRTLPLKRPPPWARPPQRTVFPLQSSGFLLLYLRLGVQTVEKQTQNLSEPSVLGKPG